MFCFLTTTLGFRQIGCHGNPQCTYENILPSDLLAYPYTMFISSFNLLAPIEKKLAKIGVFCSICIRQLQTYLLAWKQAKIINNAYGQIQNFILFKMVYFMCRWYHLQPTRITFFNILYFSH